MSRFGAQQKPPLTLAGLGAAIVTGMVDLRPERLHHHQNRRQIAGMWQVARPVRDTSWWQRWRSERACRKATGHCWHPEGLIDWWCCMCSGETDGMPPQQCVYCNGRQG